MDPLRPQPGSTIDPRNAVGREGTSDRARREFSGGNNLGLNDPRRMGKTVWIDLFCADPGDGFLAVKVDFEGVHSTEEFLLRAVGALREYQGLPSKTLDRLKSLFDGVELSVSQITIKKGVATRSATDLLSETIRSVDEHLDDGTLLVLALDEVPIAIGNIARSESPEAANHLLQMLRELRRRDSKLRWVVCGSVGFHHVLRHCGATEGVLNDLVNLPLGPLEPEEAAELAQRLFLGIDRPADDDATRALVEHSGSIPYLVHALAHRLDDAGTGVVSVDDVRHAFDDFMNDRDGSRAVTHLLTRLDELYGDTTKQAEEVLDRVAVAVALPTADLGVPGRLIDDLIDDHYLIEDGKTIRWRYEVLRRIWVHRRRLG